VACVLSNRNDPELEEMLGPCSSYRPVSAPVEEVAQSVDCERLVTSGYLVSERPDLRGFQHRRRADADGWAADLWDATSK